MVVGSGWGCVRGCFDKRVFESVISAKEKNKKAIDEKAREYLDLKKV